MGNNQSSTQKECPSVCKALCFGSSPINDEGEWFGELKPKSKKRRKRRKTQKRGELKRLPSVPEEAAACSDTVETGTGSKSKAIESSENVAKLSRQKLMFVYGQFVDPSTEEGHKLILQRMTFKDKDASDHSTSDSSIIHGIETHRSGHCGRTQNTSDKERSPNRSLASLPGVLKKRSTFSSSTLTSSTSSLPHEGDNEKTKLKDSVSSIVMLADGIFLTAAESDRNIKMWKLSNNKIGVRSESITFIRDFRGCPTGITCLAKVDQKGRFLSGSKSGTIMLWDSHFSCIDWNHNERDMRLSEKSQGLLATFEKLERRKVDAIAMLDGGSYVRPTDNVDWTMMAALTKKAVREGSGSLHRSVQERQIVACSLQFASITGAHRSVKIWTVTQSNKGDGSNAEIKLLQELEHDNVVESVAAVSGKYTLLAGDRLGCVSLWKGINNVFSRGSPRIWHRVRSFNWRDTSKLHKCNESLQLGITSLAFLGEDHFVSGTKGGDLRIWDVNGTKDVTVGNELTRLSGAHTSEITSIVAGSRDYNDNGWTLTTCGKDGMVLSFFANAENPVLQCFNVVDLGICYRYSSDGNSVSAISLGVYKEEQCTTLVVGNSRGSISILKQPRQMIGPHDALFTYRQQIKEEALTMQLIAESARLAIKCTNHKKHTQTYADCFTGSELVTYLVDENYAATRCDAVALCCALQKHSSLFVNVLNECKQFQDGTRSFYRFTPTLRRGSTV